MVTVFPLKVGLVNLGAGRKVYGNRIIHCEADGEILLNWRPTEGSTVPIPVTYAMIKGEDRLSPDTEYIEVVSGTFSFGD